MLCRYGDRRQTADLHLAKRARLRRRRRNRTHSLENGKRTPEFSATEQEVQINISTELLDEKMASFIAAQYKTGYKFDVGDLLVLNQLRSQRDIRTSDVARITQRSQHRAGVLLNEMVSKDLLRRRGAGSATIYSYSPIINRALGNAPQAARDKIIESIRHPEMIAEYIRQQGSISNNECQSICDLDSWQTSRLLRRLTTNGFLQRFGASKKMTRYKLAPRDEL